MCTHAAWACMCVVNLCLRVSIHIKYFRVKGRGWLSLPWQPSSLQSWHWCTNTPLHKLCQWGYARLQGGVFVNRDIQVKNCLFTKRLFFPLQCKRHKPRSADQLQEAHWWPGIQQQWRNPASRKSGMFDGGRRRSPLWELNMKRLSSAIHNMHYFHHHNQSSLSCPKGDLDFLSYVQGHSFLNHKIRCFPSWFQTLQILVMYVFNYMFKNCDNIKHD